MLTREERRAKREARRAKQREENVGRAAKMHAARLAWERDAGPRASAPATSSMPQVHVGCSGWFYWHWRGGFYPAELPTNRWFEHYSKHFKTVELNAPFYSWPTTAAVQAWVRQAGRRKFIYTVKASELITHVKRFIGTKTLVQDFGHIADLLGPRMGCFLFQLPPSFHYSRARLDRILSQLDPARRNVVEFRHRSWWKESVFAAFRANWRDLLLLQRAAVAGRFGENGGRHLRPLPRHQAMVSPRLQPRGTGRMGCKDPRERRHSRLGIFQ